MDEISHLGSSVALRGTGKDDKPPPLVGLTFEELMSGHNPKVSENTGKLPIDSMKTEEGLIRVNTHIANFLGIIDQDSACTSSASKKPRNNKTAKRSLPASIIPKSTNAAFLAWGVSGSTDQA